MPADLDHDWDHRSEYVVFIFLHAFLASILRVRPPTLPHTRTCTSTHTHTLSLTHTQAVRMGTGSRVLCPRAEPVPLWGGWHGDSPLGCRRPRRGDACAHALTPGVCGRSRGCPGGGGQGERAGRAKDSRLCAGWSIRGGITLAAEVHPAPRYRNSQAGTFLLAAM